MPFRLKVRGYFLHDKTCSFFFFLLCVQSSFVVACVKSSRSGERKGTGESYIIEEGACTAIVCCCRCEGRPFCCSIHTL